MITPLASRDSEWNSFGKGASLSTVTRDNSFAGKICFSIFDPIDMLIHVHEEAMLKALQLEYGEGES